MKLALSLFVLTTGLTGQAGHPAENPQGTRLGILQEPLQFEIVVMESAPPQFAVTARVRLPTAGYRIQVDELGKPDAQGRIRAQVTAVAAKGPAAAVVEEKKVSFVIGYCNVGNYLLEVHWRSTGKGAYHYRTSVLLAATNEHGSFTVNKDDPRAWEMTIRERPVTSRFVATKTGPALALEFRSPGTGWELRVDEVGKPSPERRIRVAVTGKAPRVSKPQRSAEQLQVELGPLPPGRYLVELFYRTNRQRQHELVDLVHVQAKRR